MDTAWGHSLPIATTAALLAGWSVVSVDSVAALNCSAFAPLMSGSLETGAAWEATSREATVRT